MRLLRSDLRNEEREWSEVFAKWLLGVGNNEIGEPDEEDDEDTYWITIPQQYCLTLGKQGLSELIDFIYDDTTLKALTAAESGITNYDASKCKPGRRLMQRSSRKMSETTIASLKVGQENCVLEAKVYRKWISKSIPEMKQLAFCCILIDRQANMDVNNIDYFDPLLKPRMAYRISNFICEKTKPYQQTLENKISLRFGKITTFEVLEGKESEFPEHQFEFTTYNQLPSRVPYRDEDSKMIYPILTDYLGCIRSISDIIPSRDANTVQKYRRKDDLAKQFNKQEIEKLPHPIIIAVSSYVQLSATPATHYYINPRIQEAADAYTMFKEKYNLNPPLQVSKYRYDDPKQEKTRNRQTLYTLLQQNPTSFKGVRFTCEAMITSLNSNRSWNYASYSQSNKASTQRNGTYTCEDHEKQDPPTYRYNFKAAVADGTATAELTFFTYVGQKITGHPCSHLMQKSKTTDQT
ncbi:nucleic acid-binding, OB-fold protein [Tanacetum coccineum]